MSHLTFEQCPVRPTEARPSRRLPDDYAIPPQPYAREVDGEPLHVAMTRTIIELVDHNGVAIAEAYRDRAKRQMEQILLANMHAQFAVMSSIEVDHLEDGSIQARFDTLAERQTEFELARQLRPFDRTQPDEIDSNVWQWVQEKRRLKVVDAPRTLYYLAVSRREDKSDEIDVTIVREICYFDLHSPKSGNVVIIQQDTYAALLDASHDMGVQLRDWLQRQTDQTIKGAMMTPYDSPAIAALVEACEDQTLRDCAMPIYPAVRSYRAALVGGLLPS